MEFKWLKRTHRDADLYFEGYAKEQYTDSATGKKKTRYVYHGDYYIFRLEEEVYRRFRIGSAIRMIAAAALFIAAHILGPRGSVLPYIGIPALVSIIPLCYVGMGVAGLLGARETKMTVRQYSFGLGRMENALWALWILWGISAVGEVLYLLIRHVFTATEILAAAMQLGAFVLAVLQQKSQSRILASCIHKPETSKTEKET